MLKLYMDKHLNLNIYLFMKKLLQSMETSTIHAHLVVDNMNFTLVAMNLIKMVNQE